MNDGAPKSPTRAPASRPSDPLMADLEIYAKELDATLTVPHFVVWLLKNRPQLSRLGAKDLEHMAAESLYKFAHAQLDPDA